MNIVNKIKDVSIQNLNVMDIHYPRILFDKTGNEITIEGVELLFNVSFEIDEEFEDVFENHLGVYLDEEKLNSVDKLSINNFDCFLLDKEDMPHYIEDLSKKQKEDILFKIKDYISSDEMKKEISNIGSKVNDWWCKYDSFK